MPPRKFTKNPSMLKITRKKQITDLIDSGVTDINELMKLTGAKRGTVSAVKTEVSVEPTVVKL